MRTLKSAVFSLLMISSLGFALIVAQEEKPAPEREESQEAISLEPSWRSKAHAAISKGDLSEGIYLLRRWLEADPRDQSSWYNLACAYALGEKPEKAMEALRYAVAAGWSDAEHMGRDSDLDSPRERRDFKALVLTLATQTQDAKKAFRRHHVTFEATGSYSTILPKGYERKSENNAPSFPLVLCLHGAGSTDENHAKAFKQVMGIEEAIFVAPRAPYAIPRGSDLGYVAWIPESRGLPWSRERSLRQWASMIDTCVEDARKHYSVNSKIYVIGHSMGAGAALVYTSLYPEKVQSVFAYAGYGVPEIQTDAVLAKVKKAEVDVNICHCKGDSVVPFEGSKKASQAWSEAGCSVREFWIDDTSHGLTEAVRDTMKAWAQRSVAKSQEE